MTKVTYAEYSLKCVMEAQYKFFNREKWETNILPLTVVIKDKTLEYFTKTNPKPTVFTIIENNNNSIVAIRTREFENKTAITTLSLDKIAINLTQKLTKILYFSNNYKFNLLKLILHNFYYLIENSFGYKNIQVSINVKFI
jgi:hypothetical protein